LVEPNPRRPAPKSISLPNLNNSGQSLGHWQALTYVNLADAPYGLFVPDIP
jgi:hypothetical protein